MRKNVLISFLVDEGTDLNAIFELQKVLFKLPDEDIERFEVFEVLEVIE